MGVSAPPPRGLLSPDLPGEYTHKNRGCSKKWSRAHVPVLFSVGTRPSHATGLYPTGGHFRSLQHRHTAQVCISPFRWTVPGVLLSDRPATVGPRARLTRKGSRESRNYMSNQIACTCFFMLILRAAFCSNSAWPKQKTTPTPRKTSVEHPGIEGSPQKLKQPACETVKREHRRERFAREAEI